MKLFNLISEMRISLFSILYFLNTYADNTTVLFFFFSSYEILFMANLCRSFFLSTAVYLISTAVYLLVIRQTFQFICYELLARGFMENTIVLSKCRSHSQTQ